MKRAGRIVAAVALCVATALGAGEMGLRMAAARMSREPAVELRTGRGFIYYIGDSFTYGQGVRPDEAWPAVFGARLQEDYGADAIPMMGYARPGMSSSYGLWLVSQALARGDARIILLLVGWNANDNDFADYRARHDQAVPLSARLNVVLEHSRLYRVLRLAARRDADTLTLDDVKLIPFVPRSELYDFHAYQEIARENLTKIAALCKSHGVPLLLLNYPHQRLPPNPYSPIEYIHVLFGRTPISDADYVIPDRQPGELAVDAIIRTVGREQQVPVLDVDAAFRASGRADLFLPDWHHPTATGHRIMADTVWQALEPLLPPRPTGPEGPAP